MAGRPRAATAESKRLVLDHLARGLTVAAAMEAVGLKYKSYENWRAGDEDFKSKVDELRASMAAAKKAGLDPAARNIGFAEFRRQFLGQETYPHQQAWVDLLEGKVPDLRPGEDLTQGDPRRVIINVPPFHAKSQTLTVEYCVYRICMDPNIRIIIVSKRGDQAAKFLYAIKQRLTSRQWAALQAAYAPEGGFKPEKGDGKWGANSFYVASGDRDQKDPTVEALGLGSQIYGSRADLIIMDDCIVNANAHEFEKQITWLESEVESRLRDGILAIVGTRLAPRDLYSELMNGDRYLSGVSPWTYLRQPAVLQYADDPKDWITLWPESTMPLDMGQEKKDNGLYGAWDGPRLSIERSRKSPRTWSLVYMQLNVADDAVFPAKAIMGSTNGRRKPGLLIAGAMGHPRNGMEGQYVIASMDPAMAGDTFTLVGTVDKGEKMRRVLNAWVQPSPTPAYIRDIIERVTTEYGVHEWVIEQNAFQLFLVYDEKIQQFCRQRGVRITPHYTSRNKQDPDFGVASLAPLFGTMRMSADGNQRQDWAGGNLIELPDPDKAEGIKSLIEQLITWQPGKLGKQLKQDGPMALWFFELRARAILGIGEKRQAQFMPNKYLTKSDLKRRYVVPAEARLLAPQE